MATQNTRSRKPLTYALGIAIAVCMCAIVLLPEMKILPFISSSSFSSLIFSSKTTQAIYPNSNVPYSFKRPLNPNPLRTDKRRVLYLGSRDFIEDERVSNVRYSAIVFVCYDKPLPRDLPGFVSVVEPGVYLIERYSPLLRAITPIWIAPYLEEHKSSATWDNETMLIARTTKSGVLTSNEDCKYTKYLRTYGTHTWFINCTNPGAASYLRTLPFVISVERVPYLTNIEPGDLSFGNNTDKIPGIHLAPKSFADYLPTKTTALEDVNFATLLVTDTGLDITHCSFPQAQFPIFVPGVTDWGCLENSHGTSVSFVPVGAECLEGYHGIAKGAPFFFGDMSYPGTETIIFHVLYFSIYFDNRDIQTALMSWGVNGQFGVYGVLCVLFDTFAYANQKIVFIASAGNDGNSVSASCPADAKNIISVGALNPDGTLAYFSSNATMGDGRRSADVYAPGVSILTARSVVFPPGKPGHSDMSSRHGTSFSDGFIAGVALREQERRYNAYGDWPYGSLIYAIIYTHYMSIGPWKLILSNLAGDLANGEILLPSNDNTADICFRAKGAARLTLAWYDPPATENSIRPLLNNLNMNVESELGMIVSAQDSSHPYEIVEMNNHGGEVEVFYHVKVYAQDNFTIADNGEEYGPVRFSLYLDATKNITMVDCGMECDPGDIRECGDDEDEIQQCYVNRTWNTCGNCPLGHSRNSTGGCSCDPSLAIRNETSGLLYTTCIVISGTPRTPYEDLTADTPNIIGIVSGAIPNSQLQNTLVYAFSLLFFLL